jgi:hypothetical protein
MSLCRIMLGMLLVRKVFSPRLVNLSAIDVWHRRLVEKAIEGLTQGMSVTETVPDKMTTEKKRSNY